MTAPRYADIVMRARVELAPADAYPEGTSLVDCARMDLDADPALFFMDQVVELKMADADSIRHALLDATAIVPESHPDHAGIKRALEAISDGGV